MDKNSKDGRGATDSDGNHDEAELPKGTERHGGIELNDLKATAQRVRAQVLKAFGGLTMPAPEGLIRCNLDERWRGSYEKARQEFGGRSWEDVDTEFLLSDDSDSQRIYAYCYLSAVAFQYYLPPALSACLEEVENSGTLLFAVIGSNLTPSFEQLYANGSDCALEEHRAAFTIEQSQAVCAFLEFVLDHLPEFRWPSAQALRWGWNHMGGSGVEKARALYSGLRNYTYDLPPDPQASTLAREIRSAFEARPYPGDDQLVLTGCGEEPWEYALEFAGTEWHKLHPEFLARNSESLSFFSGAAFRYFLPAYMRANLCRADIVGDVVFHLTHGLSDSDVRGWEKLERDFATELPEVREGFSASKAMFDEFQKQTSHIDWRSRAEERFEGLNQAERQAIIHYLEYYLSQGGFAEEGIAEALNNYWCPPKA